MAFEEISLKIESYLLRNTNFIVKKKKNKISSKTRIIYYKTIKPKAFANKNRLSKVNYTSGNFLIFIILILIFDKQEQLLLSNDSYITLKIKSNCTINLFNPLKEREKCTQLTLPNIIEFDENNYTNITFDYPINFNTDQEKKIRLIWENNNEPKSTNCLFQDCSDITEIDLSNFDSSHVTSMFRMFDNCSSLTSLNISNLNTSKVNRMQYMFCGCSSLNYLDLSNFDTSNVESMESLFNNCLSLVSLDISSFNTSKVKNMRYKIYILSL